MKEDKLRNRPFLSFTEKSLRSKVEFAKPPFKQSLPRIGKLLFTFPFSNGKSAILQMPANYCQKDLEIILAQLEVIKMSVER